MNTINEKRVYSATEGKTDVFVATGTGVARVECSGDLVGGFGLVHRCSATDIAVSGDRLAVATDEDVLVWKGNRSENGDAFEPTGFGPASAVGYHDALIGTGEGRVARFEGDWNTLGDLDSVRAIDGDLFAAASGIYKISGRNGLVPVGLNGARDVSTAIVPFAATTRGLYKLANGWTRVLDGDFKLVTSDGTRTHAATDEALYVCDNESDEDREEWEQVEIPVEERIAGIAYNSGTMYASTVDGTFLVEGDGWYTQPLGLLDVCGLAVVPGVMG